MMSQRGVRLALINMLIKDRYKRFSENGNGGRE